MEQKQYEVLRGFMNHLTKDYNWYYDTPEKRFKWSPESIWLINPETQEWVLELTKEGKLWWYEVFYFNFHRYFNMEESDYEKFITIWVEDVLNRGVSLTDFWTGTLSNHVEDVLNRGVSSTRTGSRLECELVEYVLRGGYSTYSVSDMGAMAVEDVLNHGKTIQ